LAIAAFCDWVGEEAAARRGRRRRKTKNRVLATET
jgi:hypothetical protein